MTIDYKDTIFLPKTDFPMRAGLPKKEPEILAEWERIELEKRLRQESFKKRGVFFSVKRSNFKKRFNWIF